MHIELGLIQCEGIELDEVKYRKQDYQRLEFKDKVLNITWHFHGEKAKLLICD